MQAPATPKPKPHAIAQVKIHQLPQLKRLFAQAVREHFAYLPPHAQDRVIRDHALPQLLKAHLDPRRVILVANNGARRIVGYCIAAIPRTGPSQLFWLYVDPAHRGTNTGLSLLSRTLKLMESRGASEVFLATYDHRRYYERQGFKFVRREHQDSVELDIMRFVVRRNS
jgi:GNAT superfamily N-acetyltransferase